MIHFRYNNWGKFLVGMCCFSVINGCSENSNNSNDSSNDMSSDYIPSSVNNDQAQDILKDSLSGIRDNDKNATLEKLLKTSEGKNNVFAQCVNISKVLSRDNVKKLLKGVCDKVKEEIDQNDNMFANKFAEKLSIEINYLNECANGVIFFAEKKPAYNMEENREKLFFDIKNDFIKKYKEANGNIDKIETISGLLLKQENDKTTILHKNVEILISSSAVMIDSITNQVVATILKFQDDFSKFDKKTDIITQQQKELLYKLISDLQNQSQKVQASVKSIVGDQTDSDLTKILKATESLEKLSNNILGDTSAIKQQNVNLELKIDKKIEQLEKTIEKQSASLDKISQENTQKILNELKQTHLEINNTSKLVKSVENNLNNATNDLKQISKNIDDIANKKILDLKELLTKNSFNIETLDKSVNKLMPSMKECNGILLDQISNLIKSTNSEILEIKNSTRNFISLQDRILYLLNNNKSVASDKNNTKVNDALDDDEDY